MSSEPNKDEEITGTLGEGTGLRDGDGDEDENPMKKSVEMIDDLVYDDVPKKHEHEHAPPEAKTKRDPLIVIGKNGTTGIVTVRCHNCGTSRGQEDKGLFIQINKYSAWFHNKGCHETWVALPHSNNFETGANIDQRTGEEIIETQDMP